MREISWTNIQNKNLNNKKSKDIDRLCERDNLEGENQNRS